LIIFLLTAALLLYTVASTSLYSISPTELGLVSKLPTTFWIGLAFLGCLWFSCLKGPLKYQILALMLTVSYLYVAPAVIRTPVWISESYYPYGESLLINSQGHLVNRDYAPLTSYHDWPLFLYLASNFKLVTGLPDFFIMKFFPLLTISMYGVLTFLVLRVKLNASFAIFGAAFLLSSFFLRQQYFGPQGIAYVLFLLIILVISQLFFEQKTKKGTLAGLYLFLFTVITLTHALTSFMTLIVLVAAYLGRRLFHKKPPTITARLVMFSLSFFLVYNMFFAPGFFNLSVEKLSEFIIDIWESGISRELSRITGSPAQTMSYMTSWSIVLLTGLIAVIQMLYVVKSIRSHKQTEKEEFSVFTAVWLGLAVLFGITTVYGSNEAYQRAFMFGLIPLTYLSVRLLAKKPRIMLLVLCGLLFLNIPAQYGSDTYRLATNAVLTGTSFFVKSAPQNTTLLYSFYPHVRYFDPLKNVEFVAIPGTLPFTSVPNSTTVEKAMYKAEYTIRSDLQHNYYLYFLRQDPFEQVDFGIFNRVYDDQSLRLFRPANATSVP
jgi:hypothetical protein